MRFEPMIRFSPVRTLVGQVIVVLRGHVGRGQHGNVLADDVRRGITENLFSPLAERLDDSVLVDDDHRQG